MSYFRAQVDIGLLKKSRKFTDKYFTAMETFLLTILVNPLNSKPSRIGRLTGHAVRTEKMKISSGNILVGKV